MTSQIQIQLGKKGLNEKFLEDVKKRFEDNKVNTESQDIKTELIDYKSLYKGVSVKVFARIERRFTYGEIKTYEDLLKRVNESKDPYQSLGIKRLGRVSCEAIMAHLEEKGLYQPK